TTIPCLLTNERSLMSKQGQVKLSDFKTTQSSAIKSAMSSFYEQARNLSNKHGRLASIRLDLINVDSKSNST
ncbi:MAG: hypothetical protein ACPGEF_06755, partial [Endozoicomonas sp.]